SYQARLGSERAAPQHALPTLPLGPGRAVRRRAAVVVVPAILDPLGRVAGNVIEPEAIGTKRAGRHRLPRRSGAAVVAIGIPAAGGAPPPEGRTGAGSRCIFPFGLAREPVRLAGLLRKPDDIGLGIVPAHVDDRPFAAAPAVVVRPILA